MIHVLIRARNAEKYIMKCLNSLKAQTHKQWTAWVMLDDPEDKTVDLVKKFMATNENVWMFNNDRRRGLGWQMFHGLIRIEGQPDDIVAILDGDDTLHPNALKVIQKVYDTYPGTLATHGSYIKHTKKARTRISKAYPKGCDVRNFKWHASHLKTFRLRMIYHLRADMFQDQRGKWLDAASDLALMFPLIEIAGLERVKFVEKEIYFWNNGTSQATNGELQKKNEYIVRSKKREKQIY